MKDTSTDDSNNNTGSSRSRDIVYAAFAADALCLGPHWIYDEGEIAKSFPDGLSGLEAPRSTYHPGKTAGDLTHYGDQSLVLLESLAKRGKWNQVDWLEDWAEYWSSDPQSYRDGATRDTLANLHNGELRASSSHELSAVSRMAPLLHFLSGENLDARVVAARNQVESTHNNSFVSDAAEFFVRAINALENGSDINSAFSHAASEGNYNEPIGEITQGAIAASQEASSPAAAGYGLSCDVYDAFPLTLWFALRYDGEPVELLLRNALAGGDNSARGMVLGMLVAAQGAFGELPKEWTEDLSAKDRIDQAL